MPEILKADKNLSAETVLSRAAEIIIAGGVVAYPTETFYGLGADATNEKAIQKIYAIKGRNFASPISVIIDSREKLYPLVEEVPACALKLIESFWPGPLTIIFKASAYIPQILTAGSGKIGIRISSHTGARTLAQKINRPLTATSANISASPECSTAGEVARQIGNEVDAILDLGNTRGGKGSTIIDVTLKPPQILRAGVIDRLTLGKLIDFQ
jgi:L-threonylcarbamoyladenylate synthase